MHMHEEAHVGEKVDIKIALAKTNRALSVYVTCNVWIGLPHNSTTQAHIDHEYVSASKPHLGWSCGAGLNRSKEMLPWMRLLQQH